MRVRALVGFSGPLLSMYKGQEIDLDDKEVLSDLLSCCYVEEVESKRPKRSVKKDES